MSDSLLDLNKIDQKKIEIKREKMLEKTTRVHNLGAFLQEENDAVQNQSDNAYISRLNVNLKALYDGEHESITLERIKETVSKLADMSDKEADYVSKLMDASNALDAFLDTHQGTYFMPYKRRRKMLVKELKKVVQEMLLDQQQKMKLELLQNADPNDDKIGNRDEIGKDNHVNDGAILKKAKSGVAELEKCMRRWRRRMGEYIINTPEEVIKAKLALFEPYMEDFQNYRRVYEHSKNIPKDYKKLIADYDNLKLRAELINWDKTKEGRTENYKNKSMEIAKEYATNLDENLVEKEPLKKEYDDLKKEQAQGLQSIDRWMIRNFSNGGVGGIGIKALENTQEAFVQKILSLSKRERLYLYYMVETKTRKTATQEDMVKSQNYVPNLSEFKNQMLATKFKITKHLTGRYVYWHKLTEAMQRLNGQGILLESYLKGKEALKEEELTKSQLIKALKEEQKKLKNSRQEDEKKDKNQKKQEEEQENAKGKEKLNLLVNERTEGLKYYYRSLQLLAIAIKDKDKKELIDIAKKHSDRAYERLMLSDEAVKKLVNSKEYVGEGYNRQAEVMSYLKEGSGYAKTGVKNAPDIMVNTAGLFWNVRSWNWLSVQEGLVVTSGTLGALTTLIGLVGGVLSLKKSYSSTADIDLAEKASGLLLGVAGLGVGIWGAVQAFDKAEKAATMFMQGLKDPISASFASKPIQQVGFGMALVSFGMAAFQGVTAYKHSSDLKDAKAHFKTKNTEAIEKFKKEGKYSEDKKERQAQREARFNQNIAKLSEAAIEEKRDSAIFATVLGTMGATTAAMPALAPLTTAVTVTTVVVGVIQSIVNMVKKDKTDTQTFDDYFNVEKIYEKVMNDDPRFNKVKKNENPKIAEKRKEAIKMNIRRQLAAAYGFSNVEGARVYIVSQYAEYIRSKLYPTETAPHVPTQMEANDMAAMEALIKSLGLKVNRKEGKPTVHQIRCKLSAGK